MHSIRNVVVGISGGVDSSVAALLLKKKGFNVTGVFMKNWDLTDEKGTCTTYQDFEDAQFVCDRLKIPLMEVNFVKKYWNDVFLDLVKNYEKGITPNPDIMCNKYIKFKAFYDHAMNNLQADAIATGHYARTSFGNYLENYEPGKNVKLLRSEDTKKDQTFFLSQVPQESLRKTMFPIGDLKKDAVKKIAFENGLEKIAKKPESVGICFIGSRNFQKFMADYVIPKPGNFINVTNGKVEGTHEGIHLWTLGQKCRIGGLKEPLFVAKINPKTNDILVAPGTNHPLLFSTTFLTEAPYWLGEPVDCFHNEEFSFKFQHREMLSKCEIIGLKEGLFVTLKRPLRSISPGQYAVFYRGNECLGSAKISLIGPSEFSLGNQIPIDYKQYVNEDEVCALKNN